MYRIFNGIICGGHTFKVGVYAIMIQFITNFICCCYFSHAVLGQINFRCLCSEFLMKPLYQYRLTCCYPRIQAWTLEVERAVSREAVLMSLMSGDVARGLFPPKAAHTVLEPLTYTVYKACSRQK